MKDLAIYGAGGFGRETAWLIHEINRAKDSWNVQGFFDDGRRKGELVDHLPVLGNLEDLNNYKESLDIVLAIADPVIRTSLVERIVNRLIHYPTIVHPSCNPGAPTNVIGRGAILCGGVILTTGISIGDFSIINLATTVGHDVVLEKFASIMPQCSLSGNVRVGERAFLGSGSRILQGVTIGHGTVVGAGSVVLNDVPPNTKVAGVPARQIG